MLLQYSLTRPPAAEATLPKKQQLQKPTPLFFNEVLFDCGEYDVKIRHPKQIPNKMLLNVFILNVSGPSVFYVPSHAVHPSSESKPQSGPAVKSRVTSSSLCGFRYIFLI